MTINSDAEEIMSHESFSRYKTVINYVFYSSYTCLIEKPNFSLSNFIPVEEIYLQTYLTTILNSNIL